MGLRQRLYWVSGLLLALALGQVAFSKVDGATAVAAVSPSALQKVELSNRVRAASRVKSAKSAKSAKSVTPRREAAASSMSHASDDPLADNTAVFSSRAECEKRVALGRRAARATGTARVGTWNVRWFPDGGAGSGASATSATDVDWLACAIAFMNVDALAIQEVKPKSRSEVALESLVTRLKVLTGEHHAYRVDDCPESSGQHLAWVWSESRVTVRAFQMHAALNPNGDSCKGQLRPGFGVTLAFPQGLDLHAITVHLKSGTTLRDLALRKTSLVGLNEVVSSVIARERDADVLVLGDFNTMGSPFSADQQQGAAESVFVDGRLAAFRHPLRRLPSDLGCSLYYQRHPSLLDHVLMTRASTEVPINTKTETFGACRTLACESYSGKAPLAMTQLSDHCPLVVSLTDEDQD